MSDDKRTMPFHPRKKLLVEHISDDIRSLHSRDEDLQKTLLTGRAIADIRNSETFNFNRLPDRQYYHTATGTPVSQMYVEEWPSYTEATGLLVDLDRCVDSMSRRLEADGYINCPDVWTETYSAYLAVTTVLNDNDLVWVGNVASRGATKTGTYVRQIIYPDGDMYYDAYTRVGYLTEELHSSASLPFDPSAEYYNSEGVRDTSVSSGNYASKKADLYVKWHKWVWEDWQSMSGRQIRVRVDDNNNSRLQVEVASNIKPNHIYELYTSANITLPPARKFMAGTTVTFEQHVNPDMVFTQSTASSAYKAGTQYYTRTAASGKYTYARANPSEAQFNGAKTSYFTAARATEWNSKVSYADTEENNLRVLTSGAPDPSSFEEVTREIILTPSYDAERASITDVDMNIRPTTVANSQPQSYVFEVVHARLKDGKESNTWMLHTDIETVDDIAGFAELLDSHTDGKQTDILQYRARQFAEEFGGVTDDPYQLSLGSSNSPLIVSRTVNAEGWVKITAPALNETNSKKLGPGFNIKVYCFNEYDSSFEKSSMLTFTAVNTSGQTPNPYIQYYETTGSGQFKKCNMSGFITEFEPGKQYYVITSVSVACPPVKFISTNAISGRDHNVKWFTGELYGQRVDSVASAQNGSTKDKAIPGGYAFGRYSGTTYNALGAITGYFRVARNDTLVIVVTPNTTSGTGYEVGHTSNRNVAGVKFEIFPDNHDTYMPKGLTGPASAIPLIGTAKQSVPPTATELEDINNVENEVLAPLKVVGMLHEILVSKLQSRGMMFANASLAAINSATASGFYTISGNVSGLPGQINAITSARLLVINSATEAVTARLGTSVTSSVAHGASGSVVTQILVAEDNGPSLWIRTGNCDANGNMSGTWMAMQGAPKSFVFTSSSVSATQVANCLKEAGEPHIVLAPATAGSMVSVALPDASQFKYKKMQVEAQNCQITISDGTDTYVNTAVQTDGNRYIYPVQCEDDGTGTFRWFVVIVN